jgi:dolichol-phosphate mannosyltransferase
MDGRNPELSVVLPVLNEEAIIPALHRRLTTVLQRIGVSHEIIYVDDGSTDGSVEVLREHARDNDRVSVLVLSRNFGHQIALSAGLDHARGDAVVLMDSDLQDPPEVIPDLVDRWKQGYDIVFARRKSRPGESAFKRGTAFLFYRVLRFITAIEIPADTGDFRLLSRSAADALRSVRERSRFLRGLVTWVGFKQASVLYERPARSSGESKYRPREMLRLAMTAAFSFSRLPIGWVGLAGCAVTFGSLIGLGLGLSVLSAGLFFLGGIQLMSLWVLGQYVAIIAEEVRMRPLYLVRESINLQRAESIPAKEA